ncbi:MAG: glycosyltransferase family 39 protein, partial [Chitinivibrionia bacterium]|nr:glycosyltransferase family 39 protein [Chitinivibrionia bacterium]
MKQSPKTSTLEGNKRLRVPLAVFVLALAVRLIYLLQASKSPVFLFPLVDSSSYDGAAWQLVSQGTMHVQFFWQAFFYPMFLAVVYEIAGHSIITVKLIQAVLGSAVCVLVYLLGMRVFGRRTAITAAVVTALYGPLVFFDGELLAAGWASLWAVSLILLFLGARRGRSPWIFLLLGICGGMSIITHATFLPFFAAACVWLAVVMRRGARGPRNAGGGPRKPIARGPRNVVFSGAVVLTGFLLVVIPVSIQSYRVTGIFSPLAETGPLNLYIGNNADRSEIMAIRPGGEWEDVMLMPVREGLRTKREAQQYFLRRVVNYIAERPGRFATGLARKTVHFFSTRELPNNTDEYSNRAYSPLYAALTWKARNFGFPFGALLPFAVLGMIRCRRSIPGVV